MRRKSRNTLLMILLVLIAMPAIVWGAVEKTGLHTEHQSKNPTTYGKGNYLYSTVTFSGDGLGKETVMSTKELETLSLDTTADLGYEEKYSFLTRGAQFSSHRMTGVKLYELLQDLGMKADLPDSTDVKIVSMDGYVTAMTLGQLRSDGYNSYKTGTSQTPYKKGLPVLLAFGSDGVPLIGPTGSEKAGQNMTKDDGLVEAAANVGGPVKLVIGQTGPGDYNAPLNAKWVREVTVGNDAAYGQHQGTEANKTALTLEIYKDNQSARPVSETPYTYGDIQDFGKGNAENIVSNYYGGQTFYKGVDLWKFLTNKGQITTAGGTAVFCYSDGGTDTVDLSYLRNLNSTFETYTTAIGKSVITGVKPGLGYSESGKPTELRALLPAKDGMHPDSGAKICTKIKLYSEDAAETVNPNGKSTISLTGSGIKQKNAYTVNKLETTLDLQASNKDGYSGVSLLALLKDAQLTVDAENVVLKSGTKKVTLSLSSLKKKDVILATRYKTKPLETGTGPVYLTGTKTLSDVKTIEVTAKKGQWTHSSGKYKQYLTTKITITGAEAKAKKTYTVKQLEALKATYRVRDSFGASAGINGYEGIVLRKLIDSNLKAGQKKPSRITIIGKDGYKTTLSVADVYDGIDSKYQPGRHRDIILAYSIDGVPLVPGKTSSGYQSKNGYGPVRLVVENQISKWVKSVKEIRLGK